MAKCSRLVLACCVLAACESSGPEIIDISGAWDFTETYSNVALGVTCVGTGTTVVAQDGETYTTTWDREDVCNDAQGPVFTQMLSGTGAGQLDGRVLTQTGDGPCTRFGTVMGTPPDSVSGLVNCTLNIGGTDYDFSGSWTATRQ